MITLDIIMTRSLRIDLDCDNYEDAILEFQDMWSRGDAATEMGDCKWTYEEILPIPDDAEFELVYATRYNGISLTIKNINYEHPKELIKIEDEIADTFPSYTAEWGKEEWDHSLTKVQEETLCKMAFEKIKHLYPKAVVVFEYDEYSS